MRKGPDVTDSLTAESHQSLAQTDFTDAFSCIWDVMSKAEKLLVATHAHPDADAVASALAVADMLVEKGKVAIPVVGDGELPDTLVFLPGAERLRNPDEIAREEFDTIVVVDCAELHRMGPLYYKHNAWFDGSIPLVSVDHHVTNSGFGVATVVDSKAAATSEILTLMFLELELPINRAVATCLAAGIYGDTLGLKTPSTTSRTLRVAADLVDLKADTLSIVDSLFRVKPYSTVRLWGLALRRAAVLGPVVWTEITPDMLKESGARSSEGEGIVNFIAGTREATVGVLLYQNPSGWRASLRAIADNVDVAKLAQLYGGGGHSRAAGCSLPSGESSRDAFLRDISRRVAEIDAGAQTS